MAGSQKETDSVQSQYNVNHCLYSSVLVAIICTDSDKSHTRSHQAPCGMF